MHVANTKAADLHHCFCINMYQKDIFLKTRLKYMSGLFDNMHILVETDHPQHARAQLIVFSRVPLREVAWSVARPLRTLTTQTLTPTSVYGILFHEELALNIVANILSLSWIQEEWLSINDKIRYFISSKIGEHDMKKL